MSKRKSMSNPWEDLTSAAKRVRHVSTISNSLRATLFPSTKPKHLAFMTSLHTIVVKAIRHKRCVAETLDGYTCRRDITPKAVLEALELLEDLSSSPTQLVTTLNHIAMECCCRQERLGHYRQAPEIAKEWMDDAEKLCEESVKGYVREMERTARKTASEARKIRVVERSPVRVVEIPDDEDDEGEYGYRRLTY